MPAVVQTQSVSSVGFMLKEKAVEPLVSAFTAVNGRASPPSPRKLHGTNGMTADPIHVRSYPPAHSEPVQDHKYPLSVRDEWASATRPQEHPRHNGHYSASPSVDERDRSPNSPGKRKRSSISEESSSPHSVGDAPVQVRRRLGSYTSLERDDTPRTVSPQHMAHMEHPQQRTLPPLDRAMDDRSWHSRESQAPSTVHYRDSRGADLTQEGIHQHQSNPSLTNGSTGSPHSLDRSSTTEITRAGVQVDPKKRKRQFANRTKTGCGTCRRRKKKCDEGKPECSNCSRGGFICEGYANKVPWPKNGITKPHPPLQSKERYTLEPAQLYHTHGVPREGFPDPPPPSDGGRSRPIVIEEQERQAPRSAWGSGWSEPPRPSHPPEPSRPEYTHATTPAPAPLGPPPSEQYAQHPSQGPPPPRHHNPRIYHHTPQTMSQVVNSSPVATAEPPVHHHHHHSQPPHQQPSAIGPPGPPPSHYAPGPPPRIEKTEKEKMLSGEPFNAYNPQLISERDEARKAMFRFNITDNDATTITRLERHRHFQAIVLGGVLRPNRGPDAGFKHVGQEVHVDTPFNCDYGYNLSIGDMTVIGPGCNFLDSGRIAIGRNCRIGANVTIDTQKVPTDPKSIKGSRGLSVATEVTIGENVYIGTNATIAAGVKIGSGAIIYPGSVILKNVPPDCVARGNPANISAVNWDD